jgi:hypothetical protein
MAGTAKLNFRKCRVSSRRHHDPCPEGASTWSQSDIQLHISGLDWPADADSAVLVSLIFPRDSLYTRWRRTLLAPQPDHYVHRGAPNSGCRIIGRVSTLTETMKKHELSLEDVVRETLRPMLKSWLDENLPRVVERMVQAEVERITRGH